MNKPTTVRDANTGEIKRLVKLGDGEIVDVAKPIPPFDFYAWAHGFTFDTVDDKGEIIATLRVRRPRKVKVKRTIQPAIGVLVNSDDVNGRTLAEHRARVEAMGKLYDKGIDPSTGLNIKDIPSLEYYAESDGELRPLHTPKPVDEMKGCNKAREDEPWRETRHAAYTDNEGLALLGAAFKAQHDAMPDDDELDD